MRRAAFPLVALLLPLAACHHDGNAVLLIVVTASGSPATVSTLKVTISGSAPGVTRPYMHDGNTPIVFPTTLSAELPAYATGILDIDVRAEDAAGTEVAAGQASSVTVHPGEHKTVYVRLGCAGAPCVVDGGAGDNDAGPTTGVGCGNGRIDVNETCDTAIAAGSPGACPQSCDDHVACTSDLLTGSDCTAACAHKEIVTIGGPRDGCCPKGATADPASAQHDEDCLSTCGNGAIDPGEACDTAIPPGAPGACPSADDCKAGGPCISAQLIAAGTCSAVCMRYPIAAQIAGDGCCPPGATYVSDADCPIVCGDGIVAPGEMCDVGIAPLRTGACPTACPTTDPCNPRILSGIGCQAACSDPIPITAPVSGDGCCPTDPVTKMLVDEARDTDCHPVCGNGVVERGETCDKKILKGSPGWCPDSCPAPPSEPDAKCLQAQVVGSADDCTARCEVTALTECVSGDHCCPAGCSWPSDMDCSDVCGDGAVSTTHHEVCDIAAPQGTPTSCPRSCAARNCKDPRLVSAGTCAATCIYLPVTSFLPGDNCCAGAAGANFMLDPDCPPDCGNGIVEPPRESCDWAVAGSCQTIDTCPPPPTACTRYVLKGKSSECSATCVATPITACADGDQCCPAGCSSNNDDDCPVVCGNGVVETGEACDRAITAGFPGACPRSCDDGDACTLDFASGSSDACTRGCSHKPITGCIDDDGCCPSGCSAATDRDCAPRCGDRRVGAGETCDPPANCPTSCPDDGDPCTAEQMVGDAASCTAACRHVPITACVAGTGDGCCPTGCTPANDWDCL